MARGIASLAGKWALITGAASGIGLGTARAFARRGAHVVLTDLNAEALAKAEVEIKALGGEVLALRCDVGDDASVAACAEALAARGIVPDVLVNNAGIAFIGGFEQTELATWQRILDVNVLGVVRLCRALLPAMRAAGGARAIVNVASGAAVVPAPNMSAYAASKGAVRQFNEVLAMELVDSGIAVHCIYPGIINTPIVGGIKSVGANITAQQLETLQRYYASKGCSPDVVGEDIAHAVLAGTAHVFSGPMAALTQWLARLSPLLARKVSLRAGRENGYLPAES